MLVGLLELNFQGWIFFTKSSLLVVFSWFSYFCLKQQKFFRTYQDYFFLLRVPQTLHVINNSTYYQFTKILLWSLEKILTYLPIYAYFMLPEFLHIFFSSYQDQALISRTLNDDNKLHLCTLQDSTIITIICNTWWLQYLL